jgi:hypothetical protein
LPRGDNQTFLLELIDRYSEHHIPYIKPEDGGKVIERNNEGALHTLIRRELKTAGLPDCNFVQRHPSSKQ